MRAPRWLISTVAALLFVSIGLYIGARISPADAATFNYFGELSDVDYSTTDAITTDDIAIETSMDRVTFIVHSTKAGTIQMKYVNRDGDVVNYESTVAVSASTLRVIVVNAALPVMRLTFTPDSAAPGDHLWVEAFSSAFGRRS